MSAITDPIREVLVHHEAFDRRNKWDDEQEHVREEEKYFGGRPSAEGRFPVPIDLRSGDDVL